MTFLNKWDNVSSKSD